MNDSLVIRNITEEDVPQLVPLVHRILKETDAQKAPYFNEQIWRWQYQTPGLESLVVAVEDEGELVGSYHYVSRDMVFDGQVRKMVLMQDLGVLSDYRRRGLFLRMADHCNSQLDDLQWDVTYSLPNHRSFPGLINHLGYAYVDNVAVYVRPLLPGKILAERLPLATLWDGLGHLGMLPYEVLFPLPQIDADLRIHTIECFDDSVNSLSWEFVSRAGMGCWRTDVFLNWRFLDKPTQEYTVQGASRGDDLLAYIVTRPAELFGTETLLIVDMGCRDGEDAALNSLLGAALQAARVRGIAAAVTMGQHPFFGQLWQMGFLSVPDRINPRPLRFIAQRHSDRVDETIYQAEKWFITLADWDVL